ncbi:hypothetical protein DFR69_11642 [Nocardia neocaledoniensis]|uniref:Uncharacterized protein n=2 Tax=Nocardia neocaledoniensis TaxID=236511 RepID=A0A317N310_9NOCA|nr:hypothetical protein DFR69_11642 [Nocardia neocaledoniensis]
MKQYKVNLGVLASRYSDLELKLLRFLFDYAPGRGTPMISDGMTWVISDLLSDGMVQLRDDRWILPSGRPDGPNPLQLHRDLPQGRPARFVSLTEKGIDLVERWFGGKPVDIVAWEEFEARIASDPDHPMHRISKPVENTHASADTEQSAEPCATGFDTKRSDEPEPEVD